MIFSMFTFLCPGASYIPFQIKLSSIRQFFKQVQDFTYSDLDNPQIYIEFPRSFVVEKKLLVKKLFIFLSALKVQQTSEQNDVKLCFILYSLMFS